jgi:hypothetical protein
MRCLKRLMVASNRGNKDAIPRISEIESRLTPQQREAAKADARKWKPQTP